ncbi:MAG: carotenoid oxygenase family protein [Nevskiaceae bacterium]|jgi:carotenoid cleavage dioxygenase|nr:carotenoid oxygenase family protein [Nevskiaceae bacterium]
MSSKDKEQPAASGAVDRRHFIAAAAGVGAALAGRETLAQAPAAQPAAAPAGPPPSTGPRLFRAELDVTDCEVEGKIPADLNGAFYRTGPDPQYPLRPGNIPFDGEGHVTMFRIENGRVNFRSRFVRNERYLAQEKAGKILFPMYRNPYLDDPSVKGLSRGTHNTHIIHHNGKLLALKEDSPPAAMDLNTLETLDPVYNFNGQLLSQTFTAHPKTDSHTGNMLAFGYEAKGFNTTDVNVFEYTPDGRKVWEAWVNVPYVGMLHDFQMTEKYVMLYVIPLAFDQAQIERGGIHWSWYSGQPTYFGFFRRGGDGKDVKWVKGPERSATHMMGGFDDGNMLYVDVEMSLSNPFGFMPMRDGSKWDPVRGASHITRLSVDVSKKTPKEYGIETLYPDHVGALPRQDDRYNTVPYRYGFLPCPDPAPRDPSKRPASCYARFDLQNRSSMLYRAGEGVQLAEACFAPKGPNAREGEGYLMGVASHNNEGGRADLVILDAEHIDQGPIATVKLPTRIAGQIHGWWVPGSAIPPKRA